MRILSLLIILFLFLSQFTLDTKAQKINWDNVSFGAGVYHTSGHGDLGNYWRDTYSLNSVVYYKLNYNFFLESGLSYSDFELRNEEDSARLPQFYQIVIPLGLKYSFPAFKAISLSLHAGLLSSTFSFEGEASERIEGNEIESEFGMYGCGSVEFNINIAGMKNAVVFKGGYYSIFSAPKDIIMKNFGIGILVYP